MVNRALVIGIVLVLALTIKEIYQSNKSEFYKETIKYYEKNKAN